MTINLGPVDDLPTLCARSTTRLRNLIDRERRLWAPWEVIAVQALFLTRDGSLTISGPVYLGDVDEREFGQMLADRWSIETVSLERFVLGALHQIVGSPASGWRKTGAELNVASFRRMRMRIGPHGAKRTRHSLAPTDSQFCQEPMPMIIGFGDTQPWSGAAAW